MEEKLFEQLQELKQLTLLGAKEVLTMDDVVVLTGLSKSHIYRLVCYKKIPYYKSEGGKFNYFKKSEIEAWCLKHRVATVDETEQAAIAYCVTGKKKGGKI
ncbi:MAG: helix-turn-helix domain-containing protein [Bacteroidales bacterium]|nr:helix-turn-helix domain-containing protein [Bacteroidales bacterium]